MYVADQQQRRRQRKPRQATKGSASMSGRGRLARDVAECPEERRSSCDQEDAEGVFAQGAESVAALTVAGVGSWRSGRSTRCVNGMRISRKTSVEIRKPTKISTSATSLAAE